MEGSGQDHVRPTFPHSYSLTFGKLERKGKEQKRMPLRQLAAAIFDPREDFS